MDDPTNPKINLETTANDVVMLMAGCTLLVIEAQHKNMPELNNWAQGMIDQLNREIRTQVPQMFV